MTISLNVNPKPQRQHGIGLPVAIFIITVLAAFAVRMGDLIQDNNDGRSEQANLVRSMMIARSGAALALNQMFPPSDSPDYDNTTCPASFSFSGFDLSADPGMTACSVIASCAVVGVSPDLMYVVTSTGTCDDVSRTIQVDAR